ncbi:hypothetical protein HXX02_07460 [Microbulbifer elongatus]|uniref:Uncharacterized protein n=1 Tax=Microbulbifer elongatus TaxID=86173 RepID=A0ABT1P2E3_9GAMM|nr:hypothetical protein [Microbulbifer elongatus]MCQ3829279.1 hypothetical protein [Microbulbifer elongatus]
MSELTYQQKMVFDRLTAGNERITSLNEAIRGRANFITAASTAIVGLITAAKFIPKEHSGTGIEYILLASVCIFSVAIYWLAALIWKGGATSISGSTDVDFLYDSYIGKNSDAAYCNFLSDLCKCMDENREENALQGRRLDRMILVFILQLSILALSIGWTSIASYL